MTESSGFRLIEHTADMGIEAWAESLTETYIQAAVGLSMMIFGTSKDTVTGMTYHVDLNADNAAELMVAWLSEIVYRCDVTGLVPTFFAIEELDNHHLRGTIHGEAYDETRHAVERQVKAVTYHQLELKRRDNGWYTRVFVDL